MRIAFSAVVMIAIVGLGSQMGIGLPLGDRNATGAVRAASRQVVYVDKAELARLHPGWQALSDIKAAIAGTGAKRTGAAALAFTEPRTDVIPSTGVAVDRSRNALAAKAAVRAEVALDGLESRKRAALAARCDATRSQLMKSSEADWKAEARNIQEAAAVEKKSVDDRFGSDLVNARLRAGAMATASKLSAKPGTGVDKKSMDDRTKLADESLAGISKAGEAEKNSINAAADARVDALKQAAAKRVDDQVGSYEAEQSQRIAISMTDARAQIARDLGPSAAPVLFADAGRENGSASKMLVVNPSDGHELAELKATVAALQARIDDDVNLVVRDLAAEKGLNVVFERRGSGMRDATPTFAGLIKKRGWNVSGLGSS